MHALARVLRPAVALGALVFLSGCATLSVNSHVRHGTEFSLYHTFAWGPADALPTGDPRLDADPSFKDHMTGAVERRLAARGLELVSGPADLLIHYHANISERINVSSADQQYGYCYEDDCAVRVESYEAGTIVVDIVDARTNRVVWRGWAQGSLNGILDHRDRLNRMVENAVTRMFEHYPGAN